MSKNTKKMRITSRELQWILVLVGGTFVTILLPAAVSSWMVYLSIKYGSLNAIIVHGTLALLQAAAIWNVYRARHSGFMPLLFPAGIAAMHLAAKVFFNLPPN